MQRISNQIHSPGVFLVTPDFPLWDSGVSTVSHELSKALNNAGVRTIVISSQQTPDDLRFDNTLPFGVIRLANHKARLVAPCYHRLRLLPLLHRHRLRGIIACCCFPCGLALAKLKHVIESTN
jgi:hypothetical protein